VESFLCLERWVSYVLKEHTTGTAKRLAQHLTTDQEVGLPQRVELVEIIPGDTSPSST
jgi:hypothetical protein